MLGLSMLSFNTSRGKDLMPYLYVLQIRWAQQHVLLKEELHLRERGAERTRVSRLHSLA